MYLSLKPQQFPGRDANVVQWKWVIELNTKFQEVEDGNKENEESKEEPKFEPSKS